MTYREAAMRLLRERGPMHYRTLAQSIVAGQLVQTDATNPAASLNATIAVDIKRKGRESAFVRMGRGVFGLQGLHQPTGEVVPDPRGVGEEGSGDVDSRVRVPYFPVYSELRHLLHVWPGRPRKQVTGLRAALVDLRGTRQKAVDWTEPAKWIPERLDGDFRDLAQNIWDRSKGAVNPRYTYGHWLAAQRYGLVRVNSDDVLELTKAGREFLEQPGGETESVIDESEGVIKLLSIVADKGPARAGGLVEEWGDYLSRRSTWSTEAGIKDTMRRRLGNLVERGLVERKGSLYSATADGLACLQKTGDEDSIDGGSHHEVWALVRQQESTVRESLRELLRDMDPFAFEQLIKRLLEEMNYQRVEVTTRSGDGGVDVVGEIELGITWVREVVQVKRHRHPVQRKDLDALRGSLYRFNAVRGTIVTTGRFARGAQEAAFAGGAAPITLIDGDKLIDLFVEHDIGVRKRTIEFLEVAAEALAAVETDV